MRHWQAVFSKYKIAQKTSYKSNFRGRVIFLALNSNGSILKNCSRVMSLGYDLRILKSFLIYLSSIFNMQLDVGWAKRSVPTILFQQFELLYEMVGTLRFAHPTILAIIYPYFKLRINDVNFECKD